MVGFGFLFGQISLRFPSYVTVRFSARSATGHSRAASVCASELPCSLGPHHPSGCGCDAGNRNCSQGTKPFSSAAKLQCIPKVQWWAEALKYSEAVEEAKHPAKPFRCSWRSSQRRAVPMLACCMMFEMRGSMAFPESSYV